ncbi:hypothetical protein FRB99_004453 [Tulasnella sp. 403]|nr:hypothetical protein FRB99_004453 [Tulasnella sp. 403]
MTNHHPSEREREGKIKALFRKHYGIHLHGTSIQKPVTDGTAIEGRYFLANIDVKNVSGLNGNAWTRNVAYYGKKLVESTDEEKASATSRRPMILIEIAGSMLSISAAAFGSKVTVDPLFSTDLACSHLGHIRTLYPVFAALRTALRELKTYYSDPKIIPQDQRRYPYFHVADNWRLTYVDSVFELPNCLVFLATLKDKEDMNDPPTHSPLLVVKFTQTNGLEAHKKCADLGFAPKLHYSGNLPGDWTVVVMEYITNPFKLFSDLSDDERATLEPAIENAVSQMHRAGYVHGDLRRVNVLGDPDTKNIKIVDWDWAGLNREVTYPAELNLVLPRALDANPRGNF